MKKEMFRQCKNCDTCATISVDGGGMWFIFQVSHLYDMTESKAFKTGLYSCSRSKKHTHKKKI